MVAWGSTVGGETAAQRYSRDVNQRGGDVKVASYTNNKPTWTTVGPSATGGRIDREFLKRGGDVYYTYSGTDPVRNVAANGRNERQYVNYATGDSAVAGAGVFTLFAALKANSSG